MRTFKLKSSGEEQGSNVEPPVQKYNYYITKPTTLVLTKYSLLFHNIELVENKLSSVQVNNLLMA